MKVRDKLRRAAALVMAGAMTLGAVPVPKIGGVIDAWAAVTGVGAGLGSGSGSGLSKTVYATVEDMKGNTFKPATAGGDGVIGKIAFGKNKAGNAAYWYILGPDSGVNGGKNNIIIFAAANSMETSLKFNSDYDGYEFTPGEENGVVYDDDIDVTEVNGNHYGSSELRKYLKDIVGEDNTTYFAAAEKSMMQATPVRTEDYKNTNDGSTYSTYTTEDVLYAPGCRPQGEKDEYIYVGSGKTDEQLQLPMSIYWSVAAKQLFWLRTPYDDYYDYSAHIAQAGHYVSTSRKVSKGGAVRPASNLKLDKVLFASAAKAASSDSQAAGTIEDDTGMWLRLDASQLNTSIGSATAYSGVGVITVEKTAASDIYLEVQGRNDDSKGVETDWYYSRKITDAEDKIRVSDIEKAAGVSGVDLASCEVWLEIPEGDSTLSYAVKAEKKTHNHRYDGTWKYSADEHYQECADGENCPDLEGSRETDEAQRAEHDYSDPTKVNECRVCGYRKDHNHGTVKTVEAVEPTCTKKGHTVYYICEYCQKVWTDAMLTQETTAAECEIAATGHTYKNGVCTVCGSRKSSSGGGGSSDDSSGGSGGSGSSGGSGGSIGNVSGNGSGNGSGSVIAYTGRGLVGGPSSGYAYGSWVQVTAGTAGAGSAQIESGSTGTAGASSGTTGTSTGSTNASSGSTAASVKAGPGYVSGDADAAGSSAANGSESAATAGNSGVNSSSGNGSTPQNGAAGSAAGSTGTSAASSAASHIGEWRFLFNNGKYASGSRRTSADGITTEYVGWAKIGGSWYAFDADGYMAKDWVYDAATGNWYYCDVNNGLAYGWHYDAVDGHWYYFDLTTGAMYTGWHTIDGKKYFFSPDHNGTYYFDATSGKWVYDNPEARRPLGSMYQNELTPDGFPVNENGETEH